MKLSPLGVLSVALSFIAAIAIWVVGYYALPNTDTHRNLAENPPILSSVAATPGANGGTSTGTATTGSATTGSTTAATTPSATATPAFYALGAQPKTLNLNMQAGGSQANQGMNFNGFSSGQLVVTVPVGWTLNFNFVNLDPSLPHSLGVTTWADRMSTGTFAPAFTGSIPAAFGGGIVKGQAPIKFSVVANKAGKYALVCGLPGHAVGGMWDELDVSATAKQPTIQTPSGTVSVK
ncbi:hypothetical protein D2Q93_09640 [Alicyclobacillaceae bacterium I2511]|nr:hypothetical protein D2Q93_09640 [Alicyclobacillaceae bacterium I2511]